MNMFRRTAVAAAIMGASLVSPLVSADTILGIYAGAGAWNAELEGNVGKPSTSISDLGADKETNTYFYIALEHPVPLVPNIKLAYNDITSTQNGVATSAFTLDRTQFAAGTELATDFDLSYVDATLYYEILDNWLNLDIGVTLRKFDGYLQATSNAVSATVDVDQVVPLGYAKAQFDLPFSGLSFAAEVNYLNYSDVSISDYSAKLMYTFNNLLLDAGLEAGIRTLNLEVDDDSTQADVKLSGPYVAAIFHF